MFYILKNIWFIKIPYILFISTYMFLLYLIMSFPAPLRLQSSWVHRTLMNAINFPRAFVLLSLQLPLEWPYLDVLYSFCY